MVFAFYSVSLLLFKICENIKTKTCFHIEQNDFLIVNI